MKTIPQLAAAAFLLGSSLMLSACSTPEVADARHSGVERRQDRIDSRAGARQERWKERGEREDARSRAYFDAM
jgi:hypothetical protein